MKTFNVESQYEDMIRGDYEAAMKENEQGLKIEETLNSGFNIIEIDRCFMKDGLVFFDLHSNLGFMMALIKKEDFLSKNFDKDDFKDGSVTINDWTTHDYDFEYANYYEAAVSLLKRVAAVAFKEMYEMINSEIEKNEGDFVIETEY